MSHVRLVGRWPDVHRRTRQISAKKARVALARKLAVVLVRMKTNLIFTDATGATRLVL
jgi:hypothetical protein